MQPNGQPQGALRDSFMRYMQRSGQSGQVGSPAGLPAQDAGLPTSMSEGGIQQLQKSAPGEAEIILKALIQRLRALGERGQ